MLQDEARKWRSKAESGGLEASDNPNAGTAGTEGGLPVSITKVQFSTGLARFAFKTGLQVNIRTYAAVKPAARVREPVSTWPETRAIKIERPRHAVQKCAITPAMGRMLSKS